MNELFRPFVREDQEPAHRLILSGLGEHFGTIRRDLNPDLDDIWANYIAAGHLFIVVEDHGSLIGTGAMVFETPTIGRIVRVSVQAESRGRGIGQAIVQYLIRAARDRKLIRLFVETNHDWLPAITLYKRCGFEETFRDDQNICFRLNL